MRYLTIEFRETSMVELAAANSNEPVHVIAHADIRSISFERGLYAERPVLQFGVAGTLIAFGAWLLTSIFLGNSDGLSPKLFAASFMPLAFGIWALRDSSRRGPYLRVETKVTVKKLRLPVDLDETMLMKFLRQASLRYPPGTLTALAT